MSDRTPTLQQLLTALKKLENWFMFGVMLGVPVAQLKKIKSNHQSDVDLCKIDMFQYWLDNTLVPTWNDTVLALERMDQLVLAAQIKDAYLWSFNTSASKEDGTTKLATESNTTSSAAFLSALHNITPAPALPDPPLLSSSVTTNLSDDVTDQSSDEMKAEIRADVTVVSNLKELEISFGHMLVKVKRQLSKCDLSEALIFLGSIIGSEEFNGCDNFGKLIRQLQRDHIDVFNISNLQNLVAIFEIDGLNDTIKAYVEKKETFLKHITVLEFQRAVVSRVKPLPTSGQASVTIKIPEELASQKTLKDIEKLAMEGFEECHKKFICLHAEPGSIIISWIFPKKLICRLKELARDNASIFEANGVLEVTVKGKRVFPCPQLEDIPVASRADADVSKEDKSKLKQLYAVFHQHLIDAVSDPESLTTQFHSASLLSQEEQAMLSSSLASEGKFPLSGGKEEPHLLTVLMEKMTTVKRLQTLLEDMTAWLRGSRQEQQQLVTEIEKLTHAKAHLLTRLRWYEEDLKEKDDKISSQKTQLLHLKTIALLQKEDSQTKPLGSEMERNTSAALLPASAAAYSSQAYPEYSMSSGHHGGHNPSGRGTGASSEGYHSLSSSRPHFTTSSPYSSFDPSMHHQQHAEYGEDLSQKHSSRTVSLQRADAWLERQMRHMQMRLERQMGIQESVYDAKKEQAPGPMMPSHQQQHVEYRATPWHLSQVLSNYPGQYNMVQRYQNFHMPPAPDAWLERQMAAQLQGESASQEHYPVLLAHRVSERHYHTHCIKTLAPIRRVQDAVTGSAEYSLDPLCPSNMEFQRRAEDELTKFIYILIENASKMNLNFKYENPISKQCDMSAAEALRGPALDFRWQLKHLEYNRTLFCREVFKGRIGEPEFRRWARNLREKADMAARKQHLQHVLRVTEERDQSQDEKSEAKAGTSDAISHLLDEMVQFTEKIYRCHRDKHIPGLDIHRKNLRDIRATYLDFLDYKETIHENMASFEKKKEEQKISTVERVLQQIAELCRGGDQTAEEAREVVAVRLAAHFDISS